MKKKSVTLQGLQYVVACILLSIVLFSCKDVKNEVPGESCADSKPDTTGFTKELNGTRHAIALERALELTRNYARNKDSILSGAFGNDNSILPDYETFNLQSIDSLVCQEETVGFRIYLGMDETKKIRLVIAGVDANGVDILQENSRDKQRGALRKQDGMITTAAAPPPPAQNKNTLLLEEGQRHP